MFPLILVGACFLLAAFMIWLAWNLEDSQQAFKFFYFGLSILFLVYGAWQVSFLAYEPVTMLNYTTEDSHYWNCTETEAGCFGEVAEWACIAYDETQCTDIDGCTWDAQQMYCSGTPEWTCEELFTYGGEEKCLETKGCYSQLLSNPQTCDKVDITYVYGNYSSGYEAYGDSMGVVATALMLVMLLLILYVMVTLAGSWLGRMDGKPRKGDFVDNNEYGTPY